MKGADFGVKKRSFLVRGSSVFFAFLLMSSFFMLPTYTKAGDLSAGSTTIAIAPTRPNINVCEELKLKGNIWSQPVMFLGCKTLNFFEALIFTPVVAFSCLMVNSMLVTNFDPNIRSGYDKLQGTCRIYD